MLSRIPIHNKEIKFGFLKACEIIDKNILEFLPTGIDADRIIDVMKSSHKILKNHPVNITRIKEGKIQQPIYGYGVKEDR